MLKGLQTTFNEPIGPDCMLELASRSFALARLDLQACHDPAQATACVEEATAAGLRPLLVVRHGEHAMQFSNHWLELRNEPDIHVGGSMSPQDYASLVPAFMEACRIQHHQGWIGSISNLTRASLDWLRQLWTYLPADLGTLGISVHRYPAGNHWSTPHRGFESRLAEVGELRAIIGFRPFIVTEFGYTTAPRRSTDVWRRLLGKKDRWTDDQATAHIRSEYEFWDTHHAEAAVLYQINDGPTEAQIDRFGIRTIDGQWKQQASAAMPQDVPA